MLCCGDDFGSLMFEREQVAEDMSKQSDSIDPADELMNGKDAISTNAGGRDISKPGGGCHCDAEIERLDSSFDRAAIMFELYAKVCFPCAGAVHDGVYATEEQDGCHDGIYRSMSAVRVMSNLELLLIESEHGERVQYGRYVDDDKGPCSYRAPQTVVVWSADEAENPEVDCCNNSGDNNSCWIAPMPDHSADSTALSKFIDESKESLAVYSQKVGLHGLGDVCVCHRACTYILSYNKCVGTAIAGLVCHMVLCVSSHVGLLTRQCRMVANIL